MVAKDESDKAGIEAVCGALVAPLKQILENSQCASPDAVIKQVSEAPDGRTGFNAEGRQLEDLSSAGVLDSAKALGDALGLALAYATGILKTAAWDTTPIAETDLSSR